jgi:hypothetical protein
LLREGLAVGLRCDMVDGLTARHALAFLRRVTMLGQISGEALDAASTPSIEAAGPRTW